MTQYDDLFDEDEFLDVEKLKQKMHTEQQSGEINAFGNQDLLDKTSELREFLAKAKVKRYGIKDLEDPDSDLHKFLKGRK